MLARKSKGEQPLGQPVRPAPSSTILNHSDSKKIPNVVLPIKNRIPSVKTYTAQNEFKYFDSDKNSCYKAGKLNLDLFSERLNLIAGEGAKGRGVKIAVIGDAAKTRNPANVIIDFSSDLKLGILTYGMFNIRRFKSLVYTLEFSWDKRMSYTVLSKTVNALLGFNRYQPYTESKVQIFPAFYAQALSKDFISLCSKYMDESNEVIDFSRLLTDYGLMKVDVLNLNRSIFYTVSEKNKTANESDVQFYEIHVENKDFGENEIYNVEEALVYCFKEHMDLLSFEFCSDFERQAEKSLFNKLIESGTIVVSPGPSTTFPANLTGINNYSLKL